MKVDEVRPVDFEKLFRVQFCFQSQQVFIVDVFLPAGINDVNNFVVRVAVHNIPGVQQKMFDAVL
jgi:hypothetical protein